MADLIWIVTPAAVFVAFAAWVVWDNRRRMARIDAMRQTLAADRKAIAERFLAAMGRDTEGNR